MTPLNILNLPSVLLNWLSAGTVMEEHKVPFELGADTLLSGAPVRPDRDFFRPAFSGGGQRVEPSPVQGLMLTSRACVPKLGISLGSGGRSGTQIPDSRLLHTHYTCMHSSRVKRGV